MQCLTLLPLRISDVVQHALHVGRVVYCSDFLQAGVRCEV
jgi:hypothetical protein